MNALTVTAPAKINLTLDVLGKRPDGFHEIRSVMQTLELADILTLELTPNSPGVKLFVSGPEADGVPANATNIVHKAAVRGQKIAAARQILPASASGLHISLEKNIPSQAGLGGGSSDAAATLRAVCALFRLPLSPRRLCQIAADLGADTPFFLHGGLARVEGLGERVTPLPPLAPPWHIVLVKPPVGISTADAYAALDALPNRVPGDATTRWGSLTRPSFSNDFEAVVLPDNPAVAVAFDAMNSAAHDLGKATLCGSGAAIFGAFHSEQYAHRAADYVLGARVGKVWVTKTRGAGK